MEELLKKVQTILTPEEAEALEDEAVVDYLRAACAESPSLEDFLSILSGFCPSASLDCPSMKQWFTEYINQETSHPADATDKESKEKKKEEKGDKKVKRAKESSSPPKGTEPREEPPEVRGESPDQERRKNPKLDQLLAICPPGVNLEAVQYILERKCGNQVDQAAMFILDQGMAKVNKAYEDAMRYEAEQAELAKEKAERDQQELKKLMMDRFDEFAVVEGEAKSKAALAKKAKKDLKRVQKQQSKGKLSGQVRYFEGQVVSRKGEKFHTVDNGKTEWNGGSKGRVMTKGKRGPGWVAG